MNSFILDTKSLMSRAAWGGPPMKDPQGNEVGPLYTFLGMLLRLADIHTTLQSIVFCCDPVDVREPNWRYGFHPGYKDRGDDPKRKEKGALVNANLRLLKQMMQHMKCLWLEDPAEEADDLLGWCAMNMEGFRLIVSGDWDIFALSAYPQVHIAYPEGHGGYLFINRENFGRAVTPVLLKQTTGKQMEEAVNLTPELYLAAKCMIGDKSDNIKGIKGVAAKRAVQVVMTASMGGCISTHPTQLWNTFLQLHSKRAKPMAWVETAAKDNGSIGELLDHNYRLMHLTPGDRVAQSRSGWCGTPNRDALMGFLSALNFTSYLPGGDKHAALSRFVMRMDHGLA